VAAKPVIKKFISPKRNVPSRYLNKPKPIPAPQPI
jgi:hypothetical protein